MRKRPTAESLPAGRGSESGRPFFDASRLLVLATWGVVCAWRPAVLGFYVDDWEYLLLPIRACTSPGWESFAEMMAMATSRPVWGLVAYPLARLCGDSPVFWHAVLALGTLGAALVVRGLLLEICACLWRGQDGHGYAWPASIGAGLWLAFPWMLGVTAFPSVAIHLVSLTLFALCGRSLLRAWGENRDAYALPCLLFLGSCLTYEAFYGGFVVFVLIGLVEHHQRGQRRRILLAGLALGLVQVAALGWNRLAAQLSSLNHTKGLHPDWFALSVTNVIAVPSAMAAAAREVVPLLAAVFVVGAVVWVISGFLLAAGRAGREVIARALLVLAGCGVGMLSTIVTYSLSGYRMLGLGVEARTSIGWSLWLAAAGAVAWSMVPARSAAWRIPRTAVPLLAIGLLSISAVQRGREWGTAYAMQRSILASVPVEQLARAAPGAVVLYLGPRKYRGASVFQYDYDLGGAVRRAYPSLRHLRFLPAHRGWVVTWDGVRVRQFDREGTLAVEREAECVWVWASGAAGAIRAAAPFLLDQRDPTERAQELRAGSVHWRSVRARRGELVRAQARR